MDVHESLSGWNKSTRSYRPVLVEILLLLLQKQVENDELLEESERVPNCIPAKARATPEAPFWRA
jgi:hypothetical protein